MKEDHFSLLFGVRRSIRYHVRRRQFFDQLNRSANILTALSGSATIITLLSSMGKEFTILFAALVAIFSTFDLVFNTAQSARLHQDLARRFIQLEKKCLNDKSSDIDDLIAERLDIESDEPPPLRVLDSICHNELLRAMGYGPDEGDYVKIGFFQRLFSPFFDFKVHNIVKVGSKTHDL